MTQNVFDELKRKVKDKFRRSKVGYKKPTVLKKNIQHFMNNFLDGKAFDGEAFLEDGFCFLLYKSDNQILYIDHLDLTEL